MSVLTSRREFLRTTAVAASAAVLAACSPAAEPTSAPAPTSAPSQGGAEPTQAAAEPTAAPAQPTAAPAEPATITVLFHWQPENWDLFIKPYVDEHPEIEFVPLDAQGDEPYVQKLSTMVAGGTPPEIAWVSGGRLIATADKGVYEPLEPRLDASAVFQRVWKTLPSEGSELRYCGKQLGIPLDVDCRMWFYNKDLFDQMGVDYPSIEWTWDDMLTIGAATTKPDENYYFSAPGITSFQEYSEWAWQAGGTVFSGDCLHVNLSEPENVEAMQFLVDLYVKYQYAPSPSLGLGDIGVTFDTGRMAMSGGNSSAIATQLGENKTWAFNWSAVFAPMGPKTADGFVKSNGWTVLKDAKAKEAGWAFLEWWFDDESATNQAKQGFMVSRSDIRNTVWVESIPEDLQPAIQRMAEKGRGLERCPAWSVAQKYWKEELETSVTGGVPVQQAMETADAKAEADMATLMADLCK